MPDDKFGIKMMYPTLTVTNSPKSWFIYNGFQNDDRVRMDDTPVRGNGTDGYHFEDNSSLRYTVSADSKDIDIGCDNDFAASTKRGYVYKPNDWMGQANSGVEMTCYFWISEVDQSDDSVKGNPVSMKGPTGEHHSNTDCCSGSSHILHIGGEDEDLENRIAMRFSKEMWHVDYHTRSEYRTIPNETWSILDSKWFGMKYIVYKKTINDVKSVVLEAWLNPNADKQTWKKVFTTTDQGGWGSNGDECNGENADRLAFGNARMMLRWDYRDGSDIKFKWHSIRPIDPYGDFDTPDVVAPPTITTFRSTLKLQRNINSYLSTCDFGGLSSFFSINDSGTYIERRLCNAVEQDYRTIVAERANPSGGSGMQGHIPKEAYFLLRKIGTPPGTFDCRIWDSTGVQKYEAVNNITADTLSTSYGSYSVFDLSTNTYTMQNGDRIGIMYNASSDQNNAILIKCRDPGDGSTGSYYAYFDDNVNTWGDVTGRDVIMQLWD